MSASRIFKYELQNNVAGHTLILQQDHLCGGCYTPDWEPPAQIQFGQTRGMQAESCGFMTGTEGWVKYKIIRNSDNDNRGLVYLYWTNPYFGVTFGRHALATLRWTANCEEDSPGKGSGFSSDEDAPFGFNLSIEGTRRDGVPTVLDELGDLYRVPLAPVFIFGAGGIWERMDVLMKLSTDEIQYVLPSQPPSTRSLDIHPQRSILEGKWTDENIEVNIRFLWVHNYELTLVDTSPGKSLSITAVCTLGPSGLAQLYSHHSILEAMEIMKIGSSHLEVARANVVLTGMSAILRTAGLIEGRATGPHDVIDKSKFNAKMLKEQVLGIGVTNSPLLEIVSQTAAEHAKQSYYTLWPTPDVALQLYRELENGRLVGFKILYQRVHGDGSVIFSRFLTFQPLLH
ncbi:MAG: hypothetical protein ABI036_18855 [Fibrobacteria bacterium]